MNENPLHAAYYADQAIQRSAAIIESVPLARDTFRMRLACPEIARSITPGQFVMLKAKGVNDPLIGRPLAMYDVGHDWLDVVFLVKGKFTSFVSRQKAGDEIEVWGPLGNGFSPMATEHLILVAGGIGQTPFLSVAKEYLGVKTFGARDRSAAQASKITFCYGARSADYFAGLDDFQSLPIEICLSTDDGSRGHHGLVTDLLKQTLATTTLRPRILCCGPEPMMEAVAHVAGDAGVACEVSLETPMACGIGICFTCVAMIQGDDGECDYKRTCVEGPVFDAKKVVW